MQRRLIVTADDAGLHPGMTEGAIRAHRQGIVTACSIVANGRAFEDAVARLREVPALDTGVHLTLVEEQPLTAMRFPKKYTTFVPMLLAGAISLGEIERELRAQIERVLGAGLPVSHLNGHQHLHLLPRVFAVVEKLAIEFSIRYIRIVNEKTSAVGPPAFSPAGPGASRSRRRDAAVPAGGTPAVPLVRRASIAALSFFGRRARAPFTNDRTIGVANAGHLRDIVPLLDGVEGLTELVTHPGVNVDGYAWGYDWDSETRALCDPRLRKELEARGIELTSPRHI